MVDDGDGYQRPPSFLYLFSYSSCLQLFYPRDIMQYTLTRYLFFPFHLIKTKPSFLSLAKGAKRSSQPFRHISNITIGLATK